MVTLASSTWTDSGAMVRGTGRRMKDEGDGRRRGG